MVQKAGSVYEITSEIENEIKELNKKIRISQKNKDWMIESALLRTRNHLRHILVQQRD